LSTLAGDDRWNILHEKIHDIGWYNVKTWLEKGDLSIGGIGAVVKRAQVKESDI